MMTGASTEAPVVRMVFAGLGIHMTGVYIALTKTLSCCRRARPSKSRSRREQTRREKKVTSSLSWRSMKSV
jgi:hypothetical protein